MHEFTHDPVVAYDSIAPFFSDIRRDKQKYLRSIEDLIISRIPPNSRSLLDVGAGDGSRAARIARLADITEIVLLEPSSEMIKRAQDYAEIWPIRAEDMEFEESSARPPNSRRFDVILCLWNVLGHISHQSRITVLSRLSRLLSPRGKLFLDLNHRYNLRSYGVLKTFGRYVYDFLLPSVANGDVEVKWVAGGTECRANGHVFTGAEMIRIASTAGLTIEERIVVDYESGEVQHFAHQGNLFYVLRRDKSARDSRRASQTSFTSSSVI